MKKINMNNLPVNISQWVIILSCILSMPAHSKYDYQVELIVFENANRTYFASEEWVTRPFDPVEIQQDELITLKSSDESSLENSGDIKNGQPVDEIQAPLDIQVDINEQLDVLIDTPRYETLPDGVARELLEISQSLQTSKRYNTLFYGAWLVNNLNASDKITIDILDYFDPAVMPQLYGNFTVEHRRYLHINTQLGYVLKKSTANKYVKDANGELVLEPEPDIEVLDLVFHRRMRSNEIHFIDHPLVGIIVKIIPYKKIEEETQDTQALN